MHNVTRILLALVTVLLALSIYEQFTFGFWGDQDWELLVSGMLLDGKKLYVDHVPVTGPLLFYLYTVPVFLARHLPVVQDYQALVFVSLLAIAGSIFLCTRLIALHPGFITPSKRLQWIMLLCFLLIIRVRPPFFADREHLFIVLILPYLLRWMPGLQAAIIPRRTSLLIGGIAAIGFYIKPHCLLLFAAISAIHCLYIRSLKIFYSPENLVIYIFGICYALFIGYYTPEYFTLVLPFAWVTYSALINDTISGIPYIALSVFLTFIMLRPAPHSVYRKDIYYFAALLPFCLAYICINNRWGYTFQPFLAVLLLANAFVLWEFLSGNPGITLPGWQPLLGVLLCSLNFLIETSYAGYYFTEAVAQRCHGNTSCKGYYEPFVEDIRNLHAHSYGVIGMDFYTWARISKLSGATWDTRFPQLWMLPKFFAASPDFYAAHKEILFYVTGALAEDLEHNKPDLVFVEQDQKIYNIMLTKPLDLIGALSVSGVFKQAWGHYRFMHSIDDCHGFPPSLAAVKKPPPVESGHMLRQINCTYDVYQRIP